MFTLGSPINPRNGASIAALTNARTRSSGSPRALATEATWPKAVCGETWGSSPEADVVTASAGTGPGPAIACQAATPPFTRSASFCDVGPKLEPVELAALYGASIVLVESLGSGAVVADGRGGKERSLLNHWPMSAEPTTTPSFRIRLPSAW